MVTDTEKHENSRLRREFGPSLLCHRLLIINEVDAPMTDRSLCPTLKLGRLVEETGQLGTDDTVFGFTEGKNSE